ncbi:MAG: cobalamin B12-binding domain-containing protein [Limnohabitans sp.]|nr:cobalamin B12-binding domain-containing protein [Limnohabitans sp.]
MSLQNQNGILQKQILHENKHLRNFSTHEHTDSNFQFSVLSIVESQIIPRLLKAEKIRTRHLSLVSSLRKLPSQKEIEKFADLCVSQDQKVTQAFVDHFLEIGLRKEDIFLELIAPAARYLGSQWDDDCMDFSQVNLGFIRLHAIANEFRLAYKEGGFAKGKVKRVMIASAPGSLHMLGTTIVADFFCKKGWQVVVSIPSCANELVQASSDEWFDVIGLSISMEQQLSTLSELISQFKCSSVNPRVAVLLGGPIFAVKELRAIDFGADDICVNAKHAVGLAASLLPHV